MNFKTRINILSIFIIFSFRDMNLSKLVDEDEPLFFSLIDDMFPGIKLTTQSYKELQKAVSNAVIDLKIVNHPEWNLKLVQVSYLSQSTN